MEQINADAIRRIIVEELGALRYAEIKNVRDSLNNDFIKKELERFDKQKKIIIFRIAISGLMVVIFGIGAQLESGWLTSFYLIMALVGGVSVGFQLGKLNNRVTIYKILKKLSYIL